MHNDFVPQALQKPFKLFLHYLGRLDTKLPTKCPYCASKTFSQTRAVPLTYRCKSCAKYFNPLTKTRFNRMQPASWLATILLARANLATYQAIADDLECSVKMVTLRDRAIMRQMKIRNPLLHQWYVSHNDAVKPCDISDLPVELSAQHVALKQKITYFLTTTQATCLHCDSSNTTKVGLRTAFRCRECRLSFNLLDQTPISHLRDVDKWFSFIDLLVAKNDQNTIANKLGIDTGTVGNWRRMWCATMRLWGFDSLATWCQRKGSF